MIKNKIGAISLYAILSMMFFLIFIMVAYNNVLQKSKLQVETEEILVDYYKSVQSASDITSSKDYREINSISGKFFLRGTQEQNIANDSNIDKYIYSNGKINKIVSSNSVESKYVVNQYVTNNLLAMYDGRYNLLDTTTMVCCHDNSATSVWYDLVRRGGVGRDAEIKNFVIGSQSYWFDNGIHLHQSNDDGVYLGNQFSTLFYEGSGTIEMLLSIENTMQRSMFFGNFDQPYCLNFEPCNRNDSGYQSRVYWNNGLIDRYAPSYNIPFNDLTTVTFCYDKNNSTVTVYINGIVTQTITNLPDRVEEFNNVWIGRDARAYTGGVQFGGTIYNVRIYDSALTQDEIIYNSKIDGTYGT